MKPLLIIGIDPGTTLAYAILDLDGNVMKINSSKQLDINSLTANIFHIGKPLIVATDVSLVPKFIEKFASQTGSKVISPRQDLKVFQKKELTKKYDFTNNHERDALVAAILAFKKIRSLLRKINLHTKRYHKEDLKKDITQLVFSKNISISDAITNLEKKEVKPKVKKPRIRTEPIKVKFDEIKYLRGRNEKLKSKIKYLESKLKNLKFNLGKISDRKVKDLIGFREKKINFLNKEIKEHKIKTERLNKKASLLNDLFLDIDKFLVIPRFKNLSFDEIDGKKLKETIFVEDPSIFSEKTLNFLKGKVNVLIHSKPINRSILNKFTFINVKNLEVIFEDKFVLVDKSKFEEEKNKFDILGMVVKEYKEERR
ncbi:MAG: DUF460 domain-containing protein [Nanoarchaeota archaeon]|nr:DUF460 domain-containing protein [Nanoarchaeota archaeon]